MSELTPWTVDFPIEKRDDDWQVVYGWASVAVDKAGNEIIDLHGDIIPIEELEAAAIEFMLNSRKAGVLHLKDKAGKVVGVGKCVECMVFTVEKMAALGIPDGTLPQALWVGLRIDDPVVWSMVKSGELPMFSIGGRAEAETVP